MSWGNLVFFLEHDWEPGLFLVGRGVIFDKCICGCGGVGVNDKKLRTAVSAHIQVTWWWEGGCLYLFLTIVCRVFVCPSVLAGQIWWRSRHMDQTFRLTKNACFEVHLIVVDLDTTDQPRRAGPILSVNSPDFVWEKKILKSVEKNVELCKKSAIKNGEVTTEVEYALVS